MAQAWTLKYGTWSPDIADTGIQMESQYGATEIPCADVQNIYYSNGSYKSLPTVASNNAPTIPTSGVVIGAYTFIDPSGTACPVVGLASGVNVAHALRGGIWVGVVTASLTVKDWNFTQFGGLIYSQLIPAQFASVTSNLYQTSLGNNGATVTGAPLATVASLVGQFLMVGDVCGAPGSTTAASFTGSIASSVLTVSAIANGSLAVGNDINGAGITAGTYIATLGTGTGGVGTYNLNTGLTISSEAMTSSGKSRIGVGNGSNKVFGGFVQNSTTTYYPTSISVTAGAVTVVDDGNGNLTGTGITFGSVNEINGQVNVTFSVAPANNTLVLADGGQNYRSRVWWSAIGNPASWPTPLTNAAIAAQSSFEDLPDAYGPIQAIIGYPLYGVIFQKSAITRASYIGGQVVFQFATFSFNLGLAAKGAIVQVGPISYFLADQGFFMTDGANVSPIGTPSDNSSGIDNWFWANVNTSALSAITAAYDGRMRCVLFSIPTGTNTLPDTVLIYNVLAGRWTKGSLASQFTWTDTDGTTEKIGIIDRNRVYSSLTGTPVAGYMESCDFMFTDAQTRYLTGARTNINCTDLPTVTVGNRNTLSAPVVYSNAAGVDSFSGIAPLMASGIYTRVRLTSSNAQALHGVTLYLENGGAV